MGTETRRYVLEIHHVMSLVYLCSAQIRPANQYLPPNPDPYGYIIFKASEVKDLSVDEPVAPARNVHDDPAVMVSAPDHFTLRKMKSIRMYNYFPSCANKILRRSPLPSF